MKRYWVEAVSLTVVVSLTGIASYHQSLIQDLDAYRARSLIMIEMLAVLSALVVLMTEVVRCLIFLILGDKVSFAVTFIVGVLILFGILFAGWIDSETILYAT